jgi:WD40 repeat protein
VWDACTGELRASYAAYDAADAPITAYALAFSPDGARVLGGYAKGFRVFDVARPGRGGCIASVQTGRRRRGKAATDTSSSGGGGGVSGLAGIISCLAFNAPACDLLAAGSYSGDAAVFDARTLAQELLLQGHTGGVTQVMFGRDGNYLYTGARRDAAIHCWDVRMSAAAVYTLQRDARGTNQRLAFDIDPTGRHLATGGCDGAVRAYDLRDGIEVARFKAAPDAVVAATFHPVMGLPLLATASGERRYPLAPPLASSSSSDSGSSSGDDNNVSSASEDGGLHARTSSRRGADAASQVGWLHRPRGANALRLWRLRLDWVNDGGSGGGGAGAGSAAAAL